MQQYLRNKNILTWKLAKQFYNMFTPWFLPYSGVDFGYERQKPLFKNVDFGIDMESRSKYAASILIWR